MEYSPVNETAKTSPASSRLDPGFKYEIAREPGGEKIKACFSCGSCSAGCPIHQVKPEYNPRKIIRMAILGMRERVLTSPFVWLCAACYTCQERCPKGVKIADLMTAIKNIAVREGHIPAGYPPQVQALLSFGRMYEMTDFDNKKRNRFGLPPIVQSNEDTVKLFEAMGVDRLAKEA
jgi:heterodisulfide reductase subunit C